MLHQVQRHGIFFITEHPKGVEPAALYHAVAPDHGVAGEDCSCCLEEWLKITVAIVFVEQEIYLIVDAIEDSWLNGHLMLRFAVFRQFSTLHQNPYFDRPRFITHHF
ncbi:hypothetical protein QYF36_006988 [Acer negundo]|nr:hypothetical protein QYF36_006988 [Acer negundo]